MSQGHKRLAKLGLGSQAFVAALWCRPHTVLCCSSACTPSFANSSVLASSFLVPGLCSLTS